MDEIQANLERAKRSIKAAQLLLNNGYDNVAASRAYYGAFYAANALLLSRQQEPKRHDGTIRLIHQNFIKTGKLNYQGIDLIWLKKIREIGDYGGIRNVPKVEAERAIRLAEDFLTAIKQLV
ncbi:MAG: HEPN domain-containing protein [Chloroflexaceae bacterium]|nr:HEPN domain-containing protein [Chloroflexaceae bacterium]